MIDLQLLSQMPLFQGLSEQEIQSVPDFFRARMRRYEKGDVVYHMGESDVQMGLILSGSVRIVRPDVWGNEHIIDHVGAGQVFAETYACVPGEELMVDVVCAEDAKIWFIQVERILDHCPADCHFQSRLLRNLLAVMASKNLNLARKMNHITPRSIRERLLSYLSYESLKQGKYTFDIPFNRQQLADYLAVDRSALSNELSKMRRDGLISYRKNHFILHCEQEGKEKRNG